MDEKRTIEQYRQALKRLLAIVFVHIGLADDHAGALRCLVTADSDGPVRAFRALADPGFLSRRVHRLVRKLLLPLEAATRRLIVVLAASLPAPKLRKRELNMDRPRAGPKPVRRRWTPGVTVPLHVFGQPQKPAPKAPVHPPRFALLDPLKRFNRKRRVKHAAVPRIRSFDDYAPAPIPVRPRQTPHDQLPDARLMRRVAALAAALDDLPGQAKRFARWQARRDLKLTRRSAALRPGRPPGSPPLKQPKRDRRDEHNILAQAHAMAWQTLNRPPDTS